MAMTCIEVTAYVLDRQIIAAYSFFA